VREESRQQNSAGPSDGETLAARHEAMRRGFGARHAIPVLLRNMEVTLGRHQFQRGASWSGEAQSLRLDEENTIERSDTPTPAQVWRTGSAGPAASIDTAASPPPAALPVGPKLSKFAQRAIDGAVQLLGTLHQRVAAKDQEAEATAKPAAPLPKQPRASSLDAEKLDVVPDTVLRRYVRVKGDFYFPDKTLAFSDRGNSLATRGAHPEVVRSLVEIAKARGWEHITVRGAEDFRHRVWAEAVQSGLRVGGYQATAFDLAEMERWPANNRMDQGSDRFSTGTPKSAAKPVVHKRPADKPADALASKVRAFEMEKPVQAVEKHPDLAPAYGVIDAAQKFAEEKLPPGVRDEFVGIARRHVIQKITAGEVVKGPRIYLAADKTKDRNSETELAAGNTVDRGKPPRAKDVSRER
jgi:hypothetical protein